MTDRDIKLALCDLDRGAMTPEQHGELMTLLSSGTNEETAAFLDTLPKLPVEEG